MVRTAKSPASRKTLASLAALSAAVAGTALLCGCQSEPEKPQVVEPTYTSRGPRDVPPWLKGSVFEQVDLAATENLRVSNYGVVVNLRNTGDTTAPNNVREYVIREMTRRGVGSPSADGFEKLRPQDLLRDPRVAIVRVDALIPPGAVKGQRCDAVVTALPENNTTSLSGGVLWQTDLSPSGANPQNPGDLVNAIGAAWGPIFVNPAYALDPDLNDPKQRNSLRQGVAMNGGLVRTDRPLALRVRAADFRTARMVEARIDEQFQDSAIASARDEGLVFATVPGRYKGDWEHFAGVMLFTYFSNNAAFQVRKAELIAQEILKPDAPLMQMSYALEALGPTALATLTPLMSHPRPEIAYHAARAAAFIGEPSAPLVLAQIAADRANPYRVPAVRTLAKLPDAPSVNMQLRRLLDAPETSVRIEAYRALISRQDPIVTTITIGQEKFLLDIVESDQPPILYATRVGVPRIAMLGRPVALRMPMMFTAQDAQFSLSDTRDQRAISLFYRGPGRTEPAKFLIPPDLHVLLARLGGTGPREERLNFNYPEIVAILGKLSDAGLIVEARAGSQAARVPATFVLQDLPGYDTAVLTAPPIEGAPTGRPIGDGPTTAPGVSPEDDGPIAPPPGPVPNLQPMSAR